MPPPFSTFWLRPPDHYVKVEKSTHTSRLLYRAHGFRSARGRCCSRNVDSRGWATSKRSATVGPGTSTIQQRPGLGSSELAVATKLIAAVG